jgi:hypothetical protein
MRTRDKIVLMVTAASMTLFIAAMMLERYGLAIAAILIPAVGTLMYLLGDVGLPRRRRHATRRG